jgi:hypothetical protein
MPTSIHEYRNRHHDKPFDGDRQSPVSILPAGQKGLVSSVEECMLDPHLKTAPPAACLRLSAMRASA